VLLRCRADSELIATEEARRESKELKTSVNTSDQKKVRMMKTTQLVERMVTAWEELDQCVLDAERKQWRAVHIFAAVSAQELYWIQVALRKALVVENTGKVSWSFTVKTS